MRPGQTFRSGTQEHARPVLRAFMLLAVAGECSTCSLVTAAGVDDDLREAAKLHRNGETARAVAIWQFWAAKGEVDAAYNLAVIHQHGDGVAVDYARALHWYRQAAERGDKASQFQIGLMYQTGQGVAVDAAAAHRWFTMHRREHLHHHGHELQMAARRDQIPTLAAVVPAPGATR